MQIYVSFNKVREPEHLFYRLDVVVWKYDKEKQINIISCLSTTRVCKTRFSAERNIIYRYINIHYSKCRVSQRFFYFLSLNRSNYYFMKTYSLHYDNRPFDGV